MNTNLVSSPSTLRFPPRSRALPPSALRIAALAVAALALLLLGSARAQTADGIRVSGVGTVRSAPDLASVDLGVVIVDPDARAALDLANAAASAIRAAVAAAGVAAEDVQTSAFNVWREEQFRGEATEPAVAFRVQQRYTVTLRDLDALGELLQSAVAAGANDVGNVRFGFDDPAALERRARELAMDDAAARASQLAQLGGVALGAPIAIVEGGGAGVAESLPARAMALDSAGGAPVEAGQLAVTVQLEVVYAIVPSQSTDEGAE